MSAKQSIVGCASALAALVLFLVPSPSLAGHPGGGGGGGGHPGGSWGGGGGMSHYSGSWSGGSHYASPSFSHPGYSGGLQYGAMKPNLGTGNGASGLQFNHATPWTGWGSHSWDSAFQNHSWGNGWNSYYNHYNHYPWFGYGFGFGFWPWWGWGWNYGPAYWYYNPYGCVYPMDSSYWSYYSPYVDPETGVDTSEPVAAPQGVAPGTVQAGNANEEGQGQESADAAQFYTEAHDAFTQGNYRDALRLGSHAAVESPQNGKVHELLSLALFASGDYRGAATEAHAALAIGAISDWENLFNYYGNADKYTEQLRALEKAVHDAPKSGPARFLLGYHYLMIGARDKAKDQLAEAVKLTPRDKLAAHFLKQLQSNLPLTPPVIPTPGTGAGAGAGPGKPPVPGKSL